MIDTLYQQQVIKENNQLKAKVLELMHMVTKLGSQTAYEVVLTTKHLPNLSEEEKIATAALLNGIIESMIDNAVTKYIEDH